MHEELSHPLREGLKRGLSMISGWSNTFTVFRGGKILTIVPFVSTPTMTMRFPTLIQMNKRRSPERLHKTNEYIYIYFTETNPWDDLRKRNVMDGSRKLLALSKHRFIRSDPFLSRDEDTSVYSRIGMQISKSRRNDRKGEWSGFKDARRSEKVSSRTTTVEQHRGQNRLRRDRRWKGIVLDDTDGPIVHRGIEEGNGTRWRRKRGRERERVGCESSGRGSRKDEEGEEE